MAGDRVVTWTPSSTKQLAAGITEHERLFIGDTTAFRNLDPTTFDVRLSLESLQGDIEVHPADQIAMIRAGTPLNVANEELAKFGYTLPLRCRHIPGFADLESISIGDLIALDLLNPLGGQYGGWSDWVLGLSMVMADGKIIKAGSRVVKNVAGYDLQKFMVGTRHTLGVATDYTLRITPLKGFVEPEPAKAQAFAYRWIYRKALWESPIAMLPQGSVGAIEESTNTRFAASAEPLEFFVSHGEWFMRDGFGGKNLVITQAFVSHYMMKTKHIFDPTRRLNPGEYGEFF